MTWALAENRTLPLRPGRRGLAVTCRAGTFLLTQEGDPEDHVLLQGDAFRAAPRRLVVLWALSEGAVAVDREPSGRWGSDTASGPRHRASGKAAPFPPRS